MRPDVDLSSVENVRQVRAVWTGEEWELHFVCKVKIDVSESLVNRRWALISASLTSPH